MATFADIFGPGKNAAEQLFVWAVLQQLISAMLAPGFQEVTRTVNEISQTTPLTPAQLADMVVRNIVAHGDAEAYAKQSGIAPSDFTRMVESAGEPPSPTELIAALRRGVIEEAGTGPDQTSFQQGIAESRLYNKWRPVLLALADLPLAPAEAADAVVEGQVSFDQGAAQAYLSGVSKEHFQVLVNTRGRPPAPGELNVLHRRGLIPMEGTGPDAISVQQGIFEGATRDKWWRLFAALGDYLPPPRTVTALIREGAITDEVGLTLFKHSGLTDELAAAYLTSAHHQKTQTHRDLTLNLVGDLYKDGIVGKQEAQQLLGLLSYNSTDQAFIVDVWDFQVLESQTRAAVSRIHTLYVQHKITVTQATTDLDALGVPGKGRDQMLTTWNLERDANVPHLTRAEIVDAWFYSIVTDQEADTLLEALGWSPEEAAILRGIRAHGKQRPTPRP